MVQHTKISLQTHQILKMVGTEHMGFISSQVLFLKAEKDMNLKELMSKV